MKWIPLPSDTFGRHASGIAITAVLLLSSSAALADAIPVAGPEAVNQAPPAATTPPPATPPGTPPPAGTAPGTPSADATPPGTPPPAGEQAYPFHAWEVPAIDVPGVAKTIREEDLVGSYKAPRWTERRQFSTTRSYVLPQGKAELELWMRYTAPIKQPGEGREMRNYWEFGYGIGHRLQFDFYLVSQQEGNDGPIELKREQGEIRYALFDWGQVWGNPTLYFEYQHRNGEPDVIEPKILLAGQIAPRWHGAFNLVLEHQIGGPDRDNEWDLTGGVSYTAVDERLHVGAEAYAEVHDHNGGRWKFADNEQIFLFGPSVLWSPIPPAHVIFAPLFGAGKGGGTEDPDLKGMFRIWFIFGWTI